MKSINERRERLERKPEEIDDEIFAVSGSSSLPIPSTWTLSLTLYPIDFTSSRSITFARSSVIKSERPVVIASSYWKNDDKYAYRSSIVKRLASFDKEYWSDPCKLDPNRTLSSEHCHRHRRSARNQFFRWNPMIPLRNVTTLQRSSIFRPHIWSEDHQIATSCPSIVSPDKSSWSTIKRRVSSLLRYSFQREMIHSSFRKERLQSESVFKKNIVDITPYVSFFSQSVEVERRLRVSRYEAYWDSRSRCLFPSSRFRLPFL